MLVRSKRKKKRPRDEKLPTLDDIRCRSRLGGLLKHYERRAA